MRRWENLTALAGVVCAVLGASKIPGKTTFTIVAIALIAIVGISRLREALLKRRPAETDAMARARRIREQREHERGRPR